MISIRILVDEIQDHRRRLCVTLWSPWFNRPRNIARLLTGEHGLRGVFNVFVARQFARPVEFAEDCRHSFICDPTLEAVG